jgi:hypothetical protein
MSASIRAARRTAPRFEVQTRFYGDAWENCWTDDGRPALYGSYRAAADALDGFLRAVEQAALDGDMLDAYDRDDYRVVAVLP